MDQPPTPLQQHWPLFDLVVRTPRVELRPPTDEVVAALVDLTDEGIHDPASMPFEHPWTDQEPVARRRSSLQWFWRQRAELTPDRWSIGFAVRERRDDGTSCLVGVQDLIAEQGYPQVRAAETGSWLGRAHQGRGLGKEMRAAVLHLAFDGFGAEVVSTGAWHDNAASLAVTASLPYRPNGEQRVLRRGVPDRMLLFRMDRADWEQVRRDDIVIGGLDACLGMLGLEGEATAGHHGHEEER